MELVSVIIPTHYRPDRLAKAINSVQEQTHENIEIIVVSDGHDDRTDELVYSLIQKDSRISYYYYEESRGGNHARNVGISNSKGEYIAFLDDDDVWYITKLEEQLKLFRKDERVGLVGCGIKVINVDLGKSYITIFKEKGDLSKKILHSNIIGSTSCVMTKKSVLDQCGFFDESMPSRQDYDLWIRICQNYLVDFVESPQLDYYVYNTNQSAAKQVSKSLDKYLTAHEILNNKYSQLVNKLSAEEKREIEADRLLGVAQRAQETGNSKVSRKYGKQAWTIKKSKKAFWFMFFSWVPYSMLVCIKSNMA